MADINLRAQPLNVFGTVGDDMQIVLTVVDSAGDPIDVSGYTISAKVWRGATEVDEMTDAVSGASNNVITLSLTDTETNAIGTERGLRWSLSMTTGGITEQWVGGKFELLNAGHPKASGVSAATLTYTSGNVTVTLGSISTTALDGRYAPWVSLRAAEIGDGPYAVTATRGDDNFIFGVNLGLTNSGSSASYTEFWTADWSNEWVDENMARIAALGANLVRITGQYAAYAEGAAAFKTKMRYAIEAARSNGLKVMYSLLNVGVPAEETLNSSNDAAYEAMATDLITPYIDDPIIYAWDAINDGYYSTDAQHRSVATNLVAHIRTVDPNALVTSSAFSLADVLHSTVAGVVDFVSLNYYPTIDSSQLNVWSDVADTVAINGVGKPLMLTEFGANSAATGNAPLAKSEWVQARYIAAGRRYSGNGRLIGMVLHKIIDPPTGGNAFGLYNGDESPKRSLVDAHLYSRPDVRAVEYVMASARPVVVDNFKRAASASAIGTSPVGGTPTQRTGTWGISSSGTLYLATPASGSNIVTWETNAYDIEASVELLATSAANDIVGGLIFRYVDSSNFIIVRYLSASGEIFIGQVVSGSISASATVSLQADMDFTRLSATINDTTLKVFADGRTRGLLTVTNTKSTKHGVNLNTDLGDDGTWITGVDMGVITRRYI